MIYAYAARGNSHRLNAPYQLFETKDQRYVAVGTPNDKLFAQLLTVLGLQAHIGDERFSTCAKRKQHEADVGALVSAEIRKRNAGELENDLVAVGVPCSLVKNVEEVFQDPQMAERSLIAEVEHPAIGPMRMMRNPVLLDHDGPSVSRSAPLLGQHSDEVLAALGYSRDEISRLTKSGVTLCTPV